jgi:hypothetical protein
VYGRAQGNLELEDWGACWRGRSSGFRVRASPAAAQPDTTALKAGATVSADIWNSKVTQIAGKPTVDDPSRSITTPFLILSVIFGVFAVVIFVLAIPLAMAAWRRR